MEIPVLKVQQVQQVQQALKDLRGMALRADYITRIQELLLLVQLTELVLAQEIYEATEIEVFLPLQ